MTYDNSLINAGRARRRSTWLVALPLAGALVAVPSAARAQGDPAAAEALFRDGMSLFDAGRYAEACPKLGDSHRLDPASGSLLALALCHEREGKTATAWGEYINAAALARRDGRPEREAVAQKHAADLERQLSRLTIRLAPRANEQRLEIRRNGEPVAGAAIGSAMPVDPGDHIIEASGPAKRAFRATVRVGTAGDQQSVVIPELQDEPAAAAVPASSGLSPDATPAADVPPTGSTLRTIGWISGGVGVASLGVGALFGLRAISKADESRARCPQSRCSDPAGITLNDEAGSAATLSTVFVAVGLVAAGIGTYLILASPSANRAGTSAGVTFRAAVVPGSVALQGAW